MSQCDLKFEKKGWKAIHSTYKGGLGEDANQPVPFPVDDAEMQDKPMDQRRKPNPAATFNPPPHIVPDKIDLLQSTHDVKKQRNEDEEIGTAQIKIPTVSGTAPVVVSTSNGSTVKKPLIEEIGKKTKKKAVVKKGFLRGKPDKAAPLLYGEEGSNEGGKEGSYSRLMSKCKVVDMSTMSTEDQEKAMRQHATGPKQETHSTSTTAGGSHSNADSNSMTSSFDGIGKGFLQKSQRTSKQQKAVADPIFDALVEESDPGFSEQPLKTSEEMEGEEMIGALSKLTSALAPTQCNPTPQEPGAVNELKAPQEASETIKVVPSGGKEMGVLEHQVKYEYGDDGVIIRAHVSVDMKGTAGMQGVLLDVGNSDGAPDWNAMVRLEVPGRQLLELRLPFQANTDATAAKFSKKKSQLRISVQRAS